ncbi:MAG: hypothetical protein JSS95_09385 [Acidobacteria bacterium]|nr:hypothetical protein [Acidobacteriota bacterium]
MSANTTPTTRRVRAYFAPVDRASGTPAAFDSAQNGRFALDTPPAPWIDLGWCANFRRSNAEGAKTGIVPLRTGAPALASTQVRAEADATVELQFSTWGKVQLALSCGTQQLNLLASTTATALQPGSTAGSINMGSAASQFSSGDFIVVDADYTGQTGFIGSGISGAYVRDAADAGGDINFVRRISLNVARIASVDTAGGTLQLEAPLPAGVPATGMKLSRVAGFVDREGSSFFQEWSALFVMEGEQGDRILFYYPRLQAMHGAAETAGTLAGTLEQIRLAGAFRALVTRDATDGESVLCYRSYLPA